MSWKDRLRPASFRGVEFSVLTVESEFGRRQVTHQAALVDVPFSEDLGRASDIFQVEGFIVGEDYDLQRDRLIEAIRDTAGPGRLVHPYQGEKSVVASGFRIREESTAQRMCRFTVSFGEAGELSQPRDVIDGPNVLANRSAQVQAAATDGFLERFDLDGFPQFVRESTMDSLTELSGYLSDPTSFLAVTYNDAIGVFNKVNGLAGGLTEVSADLLADFQQSVSGFASDLTSLLNSPGDLAGTVVGLLTSIRGTFGRRSGAILSGLLSLFQDDSGDIENATRTPSRAQVVANKTAIRDLVQQVATAELAVETSVIDFKTLDDALETRDAVADALDIQSEATTNDEIYGQLAQARAELIQSVPSADQSQARVVTYEPPSTLPAVVVAQTLYDDAAQEAAIVRRNRPRHPGFLEGAKALQVVTDD